MRLDVAVPMSFVHERYLGRPSCPKCGELAIAPHASEYRSGCSIRHRWACDGCDYCFESVISFDAVAVNAEAA